MLDEMDVLRLRLLMHYRTLGMIDGPLDEAIKAHSPDVLYSELLWGDEDERWRLTRSPTSSTSPSTPSDAVARGRARDGDPARTT